MNLVFRTNLLPDKANVKSKCPFLTEVNGMVKEASQEDIIEMKSEEETVNAESVFPYDQFFHQQIMKKKRDHSYRIFKKVNRLAGPGQFPKALEYSYGEKSITVWCANDYLGMSCHPDVKAAVRYLLLLNTFAYLNMLKFLVTILGYFNVNWAIL